MPPIQQPAQRLRLYRPAEYQQSAPIRQHLDLGVRFFSTKQFKWTPPPGKNPLALQKRGGKEQWLEWNFRRSGPLPSTLPFDPSTGPPVTNVEHPSSSKTVPKAEPVPLDPFKMELNEDDLEYEPDRLKTDLEIRGHVLEEDEDELAVALPDVAFELPPARPLSLKEKSEMIKLCRTAMIWMNEDWYNDIIQQKLDPRRQSQYDVWDPLRKRMDQQRRPTKRQQRSIAQVHLRQQPQTVTTGAVTSVTRRVEDTVVGRNMGCTTRGGKRFFI
ncbi:hypothetical protein FRB90_000591 [Tulasnella sp. 427]|nr:hypothetical protein FRB90_000591 [Tulasnella sp. 427]